MYVHCIHCSAALGTNDIVEPFPVGRALAVDAARRRRWAVCPKCARVEPRDGLNGWYRQRRAWLEGVAKEESAAWRDRAADHLAAASDPAGRVRALALEMALHEERERRAMEGELALLESAWREAEEIAAIADRRPEDGADV